MKEKFLFVFLLIQTYIFSQNFLPYEWKISIHENNQNIDSQYKKWKNVSLLTSWERQGFSSFDGNCTLITNFDVSKKYLNNDLELLADLRCDVHEITINNHKISNSNGRFNIPRNIIKEKANLIEIKASNLNYTGGISNNICEISPKNNKILSKIRIEKLPQNHILSSFPHQILIDYFSPIAAEIELTVTSDFHKIIFKKTVKVNSGKNKISFKINSKNLVSGFYEIKSIMKNDSYIYDTQWIGVNPEKINCSSTKPLNFDNYWKNTLKDLSQITPNFKFTKDEELSKGSKNVYIVEMTSLNNIKVKGYYFVPKNCNGKLPAILHVPGYSYGYENLDEFQNNPENVIELALCVRGHGLSKESFDFDKVGPGIWGYKIYSKEENSYRAIFMDCVRAVEFLWQQPEVDQTKIGIMGGSQGGGLAIATAALCKDKISGCAYFDPFPTDVNDFIELRTICKTEIKNFLNYYENKYSFEEAVEVQRFVNAENFASEITCPVYFGTALLDDDCPSHVGFSVYNKIKENKNYIVYPNDGHLCDSKYNKDFLQFFKKLFQF